MGNGMAIASLVLGILGILFGWIPFIGAIFIFGGLIGLVLGIVFLVKSKTDPTMTSKGIGIAGVILCGITIIFMPLIFIGTTAYFGVLDPSSFIPDKISMSPGFLPVGKPAFSQNTIQATITNSLGSPIKILRTGTFTSQHCTNGQISSIKSNGVEIIEDTQINNGDTFTITWTCQSTFKKDQTVSATFDINYINAATGMTETGTGQIIGTYK